MNYERRKTRELNMLSAYLDGELKPSDKQKLDARLEKDPELRQWLADLQQTKLMLGQLTRLKSPRSFTLTPDMVTVRRAKSKPLFTTLRLASSLAAILLVVLFGVQMLIGGSLPFGSRMAAEPMAESALKYADEATPEPLIFWSQPGAGGAESGIASGMGGGAAESGEPMLEMQEAPAEPEEELAAPEEMPELEPETEVMPSEPGEGSLRSADRAVEGESPILGLNIDESGEVIERSEPDAEVEGTTIQWPLVIRWAQVALAVIALAGGITLFILHRKRLA